MRRGVRRGLWILAAVVGVLLVVTLGGALWARAQLHASLPRLDGTLELAGLGAPVSVERDAIGVPRVRGDDRVDVARATGFLHAQDRFFQMDLLRRRAAGELAELLGSALVAADRRTRVHRFRSVARRAVEGLPRGQRELLDAYTAGVNAGLAALGSVPPEYLLLRVDPAGWRSEDSILVIHTMYLDLQGGGWARESALGVMVHTLPPPWVEFLVPAGTEWDAPLIGDPIPAAAPPASRPDEVAAPAAAAIRPELPGSVDAVAGSNHWAVAGDLTVHGGAIVANDMHLGLSAPNIWYRLTLEWIDANGDPRSVSGVSLPGAPAIIVGSNGDVAWGFTNSQGDWSDLVVLELDADGNYRTPDGFEPFELHVETIAVRGAEPETFEVRATRWGPVIDVDPEGTPRALSWVAHRDGAANFELIGLEQARDVESALRVLQRSGAPAQNAVVAGRDGRIGWTMMGMLPRRFGHDGRLPSSWADGTRGWDGWRATEQYPKIVDPPAGRLWTANNRTVDGEWLERLGHGGYALGARARQIRDALFASSKVSETDMLAIQLDDRALLLERWRDLLVDVLESESRESADPRRAEMKRLIDETWTGRASIDSVAFRLVRAWRLFVRERLFDALTAACRDRDPNFSFGRFPQSEGPLWTLVSSRPPHLLPAGVDDWPTLFDEQIDVVLDRFAPDGPEALAQATWGARNSVPLRHPLSLAVPALGRWLDIAALPLPGDGFMPRVQSPGFGASQRMVVAPGHEETAILHMPGGQCGHPLSPFYRSGHGAWARGEPTPLLPGPALHTLQLTP